MRCAARGAHVMGQRGGGEEEEEGGRRWGGEAVLATEIKTIKAEMSEPYTQTK